jgi:mRNA interferase RelE/StbE
MVNNRLSASKARERFADVLDEVAVKGARVLLHRHGKDVAALISPDDLELLEALEDRYDVDSARQFTRRAGREFDALPERERVRLGRRIDALATTPRPDGAKKLAGAEHLYRRRTGDYRVIYQIEDRVITITVVRVGHRRAVYR